MDDYKVKNWNEAKYRIAHWILEKLREVSIGKLLADGEMPSSLLEINGLLDSVTIAALLPFESYEDGFFSHEATYASAYLLDGYVNKSVIESVFDELLTDQILQSVMLKYKNSKTLHVISLAEKDDHSNQKERMSAFNGMMEEYKRIDPQGLLNALYPVLNSEEYPVPEYDGNVLIGLQLGDSNTEITRRGVVISNDSSSKSFRIYTLRCLGWDENARINDCLMSVQNIEEFFVTSNYFRDEKGDLWGQVIVVISDSYDSDSYIKKIFADHGWLIEQECAQPLLILQAMLPMGLSFFIRDLLKEHHRFIRFNRQEAIKVMPLQISWFSGSA